MDCSCFQAFRSRKKKGFEKQETTPVSDGVHNQAYIEDELLQDNAVLAEINHVPEPRTNHITPTGTNRELDTQSNTSLPEINLTENKILEYVDVELESKHVDGLGLNVCGNLTNGIIVSDIHENRAAHKSGKIQTGDKILSVMISFENIVYEDALTILSYATPYPITLRLARGCNSPATISTCPSIDHEHNAIYHPIYRSQSLGAGIGRPDRRRPVRPGTSLSHAEFATLEDEDESLEKNKFGNMLNLARRDSGSTASVTVRSDDKTSSLSLASVGEHTTPDGSSIIDLTRAIGELSDPSDVDTPRHDAMSEETNHIHISPDFHTGQAPISTTPPEKPKRLLTPSPSAVQEEIIQTPTYDPTATHLSSPPLQLDSDMKIEFADILKRECSPEHTHETEKAELVSEDPIEPTHTIYQKSQLDSLGTLENGLDVHYVEDNDEINFVEAAEDNSKVDDVGESSYDSKELLNRLELDREKLASSPDDDKPLSVLTIRTDHETTDSKRSDQPSPNDSGIISESPLSDHTSDFLSETSHAPKILQIKESKFTQPEPLLIQAEMHASCPPREASPIDSIENHSDSPIVVRASQSPVDPISRSETESPIDLTVKALEPSKLEDEIDGVEETANVRLRSSYDGPPRERASYSGSWKSEPVQTGNSDLVNEVLDLNSRVQEQIDALSMVEPIRIPGAVNKRRSFTDPPVPIIDLQTSSNQNSSLSTSANQISVTVPSPPNSTDQQPGSSLNPMSTSSYASRDRAGSDNSQTSQAVTSRSQLEVARAKFFQDLMSSSDIFKNTTPSFHLSSESLDTQTIEKKGFEDNNNVSEA